MPHMSMTWAAGEEVQDMVDENDFWDEVIWDDDDPLLWDNEDLSGDVRRDPVPLSFHDAHETERGQSP